MAGNPCYLLTITSDVAKNDIKLGKAEGSSTNPSEPNTAKLKGHSGTNLNSNNFSKSAPT